MRASAGAGKVFLVQVMRRFPLGASRTAIKTPSRLFNVSPQGPGLEGHHRRAYAFFANDYQASRLGTGQHRDLPKQAPAFTRGVADWLSCFPFDATKFQYDLIL